MEKKNVEGHIQERKRKRIDLTANHENEAKEEKPHSSQKKRRDFKQAKPIAQQHGEFGAKIGKDVLKSIFGAGEK